VLGFQSKSDAERFWKELAERFGKFRLELHPEKTRLLEFGPFAAENRKKRGQGKPETFNFLGFTHICAKKRSNGRFTVLRQTIRKRLQAKLSEVESRALPTYARPHPRIGQVAAAPSLVTHPLLRGAHERSGTYLFDSRLAGSGTAALSRRSQNGRVLWDECAAHATDGCLPPASATPIPLRRLGVIT